MDFQRTLSMDINNEINPSEEKKQFCGSYCFYCSAYTEFQQFGYLEDKSKFIVEDPFCHFTKNLNQIKEEQAVIAYIPNISNVNIINLQRSIFVALRSNNEIKRKEALNIQKWLISHEKYTKKHLLTSSPVQFSKAINKLKNELNKTKEELIIYLNGLHVIYVDFSIFNRFERGIINNTKEYPVELWDKFRKKIL